MIGTSNIEMGPLTTCMRCAVYTFQLAICDSMKDHSIQGILPKSESSYFENCSRITIYRSSKTGDDIISKLRLYSTVYYSLKAYRDEG